MVVWTHLKNISQLGWLFPIYIYIYMEKTNKPPTSKFWWWSFFQYQIQVSFWRTYLEHHPSDFFSPQWLQVPQKKTYPTNGWNNSVSETSPIRSMVLLYMVTFTIHIPPMLAYIPYMDPVGHKKSHVLSVFWMVPRVPMISIPKKKCRWNDYIQCEAPVR